MQTGLAYRRDIDGLRAVAVLLVILFHLDVSGVSGGFVGVDMFYVISGFVIFRKIIDDLNRGVFSFARFYARRVRRISPALALTLIFVLLLGYLIATPGEYDQMAQSGLAALFSASNIYFFDRLNYFSASVRATPLAHTWSLGVEEQFYLCAPLLGALFVHHLRRERILFIILAIVLLSFAYNLFAFYILSNEKHAFYLPMARFWEIGVGGLAALMEGRFRHTLLTHRLFSLAGLAGLLASATLINTSSPFPAFTALLPVLSTLLLIAAEPGEGSLHERAATAAPATFFGHISYSLYLFHWPLIVFYGLYIGRDLTGAEKLALFAIMVGLSTLSWKYVENPFRAIRPPDAMRHPFRLMAGLALAILLASLTVILKDGLPARMSPASLEALAAGAPVHAESPVCTPRAGTGFDHKVQICGSPGPDDRYDFVLLGDSHADMLATPLLEEMARQQRRGLLVSMADCPPLAGVHTAKRKNREKCQALVNWMMAFVGNHHVPVVVLASRWALLASHLRAPGDGQLSRTLFDTENGERETGLSEALQRTLARLQAHGARIVLVGPVPEINFDVPNMLARAIHLGDRLPEVPFAGFTARQERVLAAFAPLEKQPGVSVVYPHQQLCDRERCQIEQDGAPLYSDDDHLNRKGIERVLPEITRAITATLQQTPASARE